MWNPIKTIKDKFSGKAKEGAPEAPALLEAAASGGAPDMKELEKKGLMRQFFRRWKDPAFLQQLKTLAARMQADGVDLKDQNAVKAWMEKHQKDLASGNIAAPSAPSQKTVVKTGPDLGRNDPCHCGSGKKLKKCHGA